MSDLKCCTIYWLCQQRVNSSNWHSWRINSKWRTCSFTSADGQTE